MSVYQVEQYYICTDEEVEISEESRVKIKTLLSDEGWTDYDIRDDGQIIVDGIECESEALELENKIELLIKGSEL
jgi:hypothetical protein